MRGMDRKKLLSKSQAVKTQEMMNDTIIHGLRGRTRFFLAALFMSCFMLLGLPLSKAQMPGGKAVQVSHATQVVGGKRYFIHIVEQGQTVYAITRAYGLKEVEAVTKKDIHFLQIGDTVWLPCKGQRLSDGTLAPPAVSSQQSSEDGQSPAVGGQSSSVGNPSSSSVGQSSASADVQGTPATIRPRVDAKNVVVSLMMPLYLSQLDIISTSKFDVEQRGKITYKSFEFIQFYEGLQLGLEQLERMGYHVTLNVVDVEGNSDEAVEQAFRSHNVAQSDLLIALLTRQPFEKAAQLAREANLFIVNPVSDRSEIVKGNPYVFKCMPSKAACAKSTVRAIHRLLPNGPVYVVHSGSKTETMALQAMTDELNSHPEMQWQQFNWSGATKLTNALKAAPKAAVVSLYDQDRSKKRIYVGQLLNKLSAFKGKMPYLFTFDDWSVDYGDIDFAQLQNLNYHTFYFNWNTDNEDHAAFMQLFRERYKTEPTSNYAGMANDIIIYFVCGIQQKGTDFFRTPVLKQAKGMLNPMVFAQTRADWGFENQSAILHRMVDYHFNPVP